MTGRSAPEWIGATADTPVPKRVKLRVFEREGGVCYLTGRKIMAGDEWDAEHVKPLHLARPGENLNRESNLKPALRPAHREKTAREMTAKAKADRIRAKHLGIFPETKFKLRGRGFAPGRNRQFEQEKPR